MKERKKERKRDREPDRQTEMESESESAESSRYAFYVFNSNKDNYLLSFQHRKYQTLDFVKYGLVEWQYSN